MENYRFNAEISVDTDEGPHKAYQMACRHAYMKNGSVLPVVSITPKRLEVAPNAWAVRDMLQRLAEKTRRANAIQHSGAEILPEDWSELDQLTNEAFGLLDNPAAAPAESGEYTGGVIAPTYHYVDGHAEVRIGNKVVSRNKVDDIEQAKRVFKAFYLCYYTVSPAKHSDLSVLVAVEVTPTYQQLKDAIARIVEANGDYFTDAAECETSVEELRQAIASAGDLLTKE